MKAAILVTTIKEPLTECCHPDDQGRKDLSEACTAPSQRFLTKLESTPPVAPNLVFDMRDVPYEETGCPTSRT
jgi:hypothetical protein